jgi:glycosyltransferase involved in cell wall biosynthesis
MSEDPVPLTLAAWDRYRRTGSPDDVVPVSPRPGTGATPHDASVPRVSILTPTIEGREELLAEAAESVQRQTEEVAHLVYLDTERLGPATCRNRMLDLVTSEYVGFLDDDDLIDPTHVAALMAMMVNGEGRPDLAWSRCRVWYAEGVWAPRIPQGIRPDYNALLHGGRNFIPVTVIARTDSIRAAGGFDPGDRYEDYELWRRMLSAGQRFAYLPIETWTYRFFGHQHRTVTG